MTRVIAICFVLTVLLSGCWGRVYTEYDEGYPPEAYIATATPVYYEGYPSYWYNNRWYRREGAGWRSYRNEPEYLRSYRVRSPVVVVRPSYGRGQYYGQPSVHAAVPVNPSYNSPPRPPSNYHGAAPARGGRHR